MNKHCIYHLKTVLIFDAIIAIACVVTYLLLEHKW
jgi:hypothetical protein